MVLFLIIKSRGRGDIGLLLAQVLLGFGSDTYSHKALILVFPWSLYFQVGTIETRAILISIDNNNIYFGWQDLYFQI